MDEPGFSCGGCGKRHDGLPFSYGSAAPAYWRDGLAADEKSLLEDEVCIIQAERYFVRARLVIPVKDAEQDFEWGVWVSLSSANFSRMLDMWTTPGREDQPAYPGWFSTALPVYRESTLNLRTEVHTGPVGERPHVILEPTWHQLAVEQHEGINRARVREFAEQLLHTTTKPAPG